MFGLKNVSGSCWVNTCLQALFRIPEVQARYSSELFEQENEIDKQLRTIWISKGTHGLHEFFESVRTETMPAGNDIGDSHELLQFLCDKLSFLDKLFRFKIADTITCVHCKHQDIQEDTVIEFSIATFERNALIKTCIEDTVKPNKIDGWKCEKCSRVGCLKQQLIGSFPKVMMFHLLPTNGTVEYSSILSLNKHQYALLSVSCFNGGHWWSYGRDMPVGSNWYTLNDQLISNHGPKQFPLSSNMRLLIYYRIEN
jgi:ubiquitin C-terminal hydrolase